MAAGLPIAEFPAIVANPDLVHTLVDELNISWLGINQGHPPLDQLLVRQAIAHAIDRQALLDAFLSDLGVLAQGFVHPSLERAPRSWPFDFDPQRARALLLEAGFPDGFDITLWHRPNTHATMPAPRAAAEAVASYLADIGIRVRIETTDSSAYNSLRRQGDFALFQGTWTADFADADSFLGILFGSFVGSELGWDDPAVADALERARGSADVVEREQLYQGVEERIALAVAAIPMAHGRALHGHRSNIENWIGSPLGFWWAPLHDVVKR